MNEPRRSPPLIVLDTNVVLDLFHFDDPMARPLREALEAGALRAVVSAATLAEWQRVLAYPCFGLNPAARQARLAQYLACCECVVPPAVSGAPRCRDPDDQKFLDLAAAMRLPLVSKDRAVLRLKRGSSRGLRIFTPDEAVRWLAGAA